MSEVEQHMVEQRVVEQTVRIRARPETVWRYWTDPERMSDWWGAARLDPRPGGEYVVEMEGGPTMRGEYVDLVPFERIVFLFGWDPAVGTPPPLAPSSTVVEVTLAPDGDDTILTVCHRGLPASLLDRHDSGWVAHLPVLAAAVADGRRGSLRP